MARFAEFFAGIGLVRLALEPLGWECAFANDISPQKAEMYTAHFGDDHFAVRDVADLSVSDLPPDIRLFTASFPCIDLSLAGNRGGVDGRHSSVVWTVLDLLDLYSKIQSPPPAVLLENVVGFVTSNGGRDLARVIARLNQLGYRCDVVVVDARWFVPQSRPRVFVIALRTDDPVISMGTPVGLSRLRPETVLRFHLRYPELDLGMVPLPSPRESSDLRLVDLLEEVPPDSDLWWSPEKVDTLVEGMARPHAQRIAELRQQDRVGVGTIYRRVRNGKTVGEIRTDGIAGCLRTPTGGSSVQFVLWSQGNRLRVRRMTAREYARLQGVPDDYPIAVPERQALYGFGDGICVPAVRWLAEHAFSHVLDDSQPNKVTGCRLAQAAQPRLLESRAAT